MNLKVYEKTRYQNIYRHKKNKNYIIMMSKPVKTSIASTDGKKILKLDEALKIRDNYKIKAQKGIEVAHKEDFDSLLDKYMDYCKYELKLSFSTLKKKKLLYNKYFKNKFDKISKITKQDMIIHINNLNCSNKQKNELIKIIKPFFNWCVNNEIIFKSPMAGIKEFKVTKHEMKYWVPEELKKFILTVNNDIENNINKEIAYRTKILILIGFNLGDRIGETRALSFTDFNKEKNEVKIYHSINYDNTNSNYLSSTKTYHSQRMVQVSNKLLNEIYTYKNFLINELGYDISDNELIFSNHITKKPLSDTLLRKQFYYYCDKAEVSKIRLYDLRHTYVATMMMEGKELYHISERLGHTNYNTTVNKYGHLSNKVRKEIAETTDKYY